MLFWCVVVRQDLGCTLSVTICNWNNCLNKTEFISLFNSLPNFSLFSSSSPSLSLSLSLSLSCVLISIFKQTLGQDWFLTLSLLLLHMIGENTTKALWHYLFLESVFPHWLLDLPDDSVIVCSWIIGERDCLDKYEQPGKLPVLEMVAFCWDLCRVHHINLCSPNW